MNYTQANDQLTGRCKDARKMANNTYLQRRENGDIALKLHQTDVVTYHRDKSITITSGGWKTATTKERINRYLPKGYGISQAQGVWTLHYVKRVETGEVSEYGYKETEVVKSNSVAYFDGMTIGARGGLPTGKGQTKELKLIKQINVYAKGYTKALLAGKIAEPSGGDCWGCCMKNEDGKTVMGISHLIDHMKDKYYVPSLLINAGTDVPTAPIVKGFIHEAMRGGDVTGFATDILKRDVPVIIRKYMKRQLGLAN